MSLDGHTVKVHRVGYMQFNGYLPPKKHVDHLCRNRRCWNPDHLEAVTHKQNQRRRRKAVLSQVQLPDHFNCKTDRIIGIDMGVEPGFTVLASYDSAVSSLPRLQCACEKLGVNRGSKRCPACPKNQVETPVPSHEAPRPGTAEPGPTAGTPVAPEPSLGSQEAVSEDLDDSSGDTLAYKKVGL